MPWRRIGSRFSRAFGIVSGSHVPWSLISRNPTLCNKWPPRPRVPFASSESFVSNEILSPSFAPSSATNRLLFIRKIEINSLPSFRDTLSSSSSSSFFRIVKIENYLYIISIAYERLKCFVIVMWISMKKLFIDLKKMFKTRKKYLRGIR